jgi:hypothetical protein
MFVHEKYRIVNIEDALVHELVAAPDHAHPV